MSIKNNRISKENASDSPGWLTTFNDLVTLLMVFFVLLFTMGSVDTKMLKDFEGCETGTGQGQRFDAG